MTGNADNTGSAQNPNNYTVTAVIKFDHYYILEEITDQVYGAFRCVLFSTLANRDFLKF